MRKMEWVDDPDEPREVEAGNILAGSVFFLMSWMSYAAGVALVTGKDAIRLLQALEEARDIAAACGIAPEPDAVGVPVQVVRRLVAAVLARVEMARESIGNTNAACLYDRAGDAIVAIVSTGHDFDERYLARCYGHGSDDDRYVMQARNAIAEAKGA